MSAGAQIWQVSDYEWWIAPADATAEDVLRAYLETDGSTREDYLEMTDGEMPGVITEESLDRLKYFDEDDGVTLTFREQLAIEAAAGLDRPQPFANTEC